MDPLLYAMMAGDASAIEDLSSSSARARARRWGGKRGKTRQKRMLKAGNSVGYTGKDPHAGRRRKSNRAEAADLVRVTEILKDAADAG